MSLLLTLALLIAPAAPPAPTANAIAQLPATTGTESVKPAEPAADRRIDQAAAAIKSGRPAEALPILDTLIIEFERAHPANSDTLVYAADNLTQTIHYSMITAALKKNGIVVDGSWALAYFMKGFALVDLKRSDEALAYFDKAVALSPEDSQYLSERAEWYKSRQQWDKAFDGFDAANRAVNFSSDSSKVSHSGRALRGMAFVRIEQGRLDDAEKLLKQALKLNRNDARAKEELALIKSMRRKS